MNAQKLQRNKKSTIPARIFFLAGAGVLICMAVFVLIGVREIIEMKNTLSVIQNALERVKDDALHARFSRIDSEITTAQRALSELTNIARNAAVFSSPFSPFKKRREEALLFLSYASLILNNAKELAHISVPIARIALTADGDMHVRNMSESDKKRILDILAQSQPSLVGMNASLTLLEQRLATFSSDVFPSVVLTARMSLQQSAQFMQKGIDRILPLVSIVPPLLGHDRETTYLLLFQNNAEVRATGGFIGTYGTVTLRNGNIIRFFTDNVYNLDDQASSLNVAPPLPLRQYGAIKKWFLRDSNWSPDFTQAARQAIWFYNREGGKETIDGVIALTPDVISSFMRIIGDISVDDLNFKSDQFYDQLQYQVEKGYERRGISKKERKDVIRMIADELLKHFSAMSIVEWSTIEGVIRSRFADKSILVYSTHPQIQEVLSKAGWSGEIIYSQGDSLMVVDSNIISLKTDAVMDKNILYQITEQEDGSLHAHLELAYQNNGTFSWTSTTYKDYVRVLIPDGSTLISSSEPLEISHEYGKMLLGRFISIDPQKKTVLTAEYRLPHTIEDAVKKGLYTLFVQKQSGISTQHFTFNSTFKKPFLAIEPASLAGSNVGQGRFEFSTLLQTDNEIKLSF